MSLETINHPITLSYTAFDVLYAAECGEGAAKPAGLEGLSPGATYEERIDIVGQALRELRDNDLAIVDNPVPELLETIRLLRSAEARMFGLYATDDRGAQTTGGFHLAESGELAVRVIRTSDQITFEPVAAGRLSAAVAALVPEAQPISGGRLVLPLQEDESEDLADDWFQTDLNIGLEDSEDEVQRGWDRLTILTTRPQQWVMQVATTHMNGTGTYAGCGFPLNYYSSEHGAFIVVDKRLEESSEPHRHLIPVDRGVLCGELQRLCEQTLITDIPLGSRLST